VKPKHERRELEKLYKEIPTFECIPGCHDCCGPVTGTREELRRAPKLNSTEGWVQMVLDGKVIWDGCLICPYVTEAGCGIYEDRPMICRIYGATEDPALQCPHGRKPEKPLTVTQTRMLFDRYLKVGGLVPMREKNAPVLKILGEGDF
jgi:hypothetical protein